MGVTIPKSEGVSQSSASLSGHPWRLFAVVLLAVLFATNIYRAVTQSVSHDEATFFEWMLTGPWSQVLDFEHGNHHVLSDLLCKLTVSVFGVSEISLRIPALLGGLLYFYSVFRISTFVFGESPLLLLSVALLSLNPFVQDYLACARGYGPALGFFFYGISEYIRYLADRSVRSLHLSGLALGLSIASNPVMIFPAGSLIAAVLMITLAAAFIDAGAHAPTEGKEKKSGRPAKKRRRDPSPEQTSGLTQIFLHFVLPAIVVAVFFLTLPKRLIDVEAGYTGPASLLAILTDLIRYSFVHSPTRFPGLAAWFPVETLIWFVTNLVVPFGLVTLIVIAIRITAIWVAKRSFGALPLGDRFLLVLAIALPVNILLIALSRHLLGQPYPELRTAMYWLPLLGLASLLILRRLDLGDRIERLSAVPLTVLLTLCVVQFATQFNTRYFAEWAYCAAGKDMMKIISSEHARTPGRKVTVGATWQLEPVVNFYRVAWNLDWIAPVGREGPNQLHDYYVLGAGDVSLVDSLRLTPLLRDQLSGTALAKRSDL